MPIADLRQSMDQARRGSYAMPSFNVFDSATLLGAVAASVRRGVPLSLAIDEAHFIHTDFEGLVAMARAIAERAPIPISIHVDHIREPQTVARAIRAGCSSILFDGYDMGYEEKVRLTRGVVEQAHSVSLTVEAELGHVGQLHGRVGFVESSIATNPRQVGDFVRRTGIDVVAVSIGSTSGMTSQSATLDLGLLAQIAQAAPCYLSLHGGSGIPFEQIRQAVKLGVCKLSVFTRLADSGLAAGLSFARAMQSPGLPSFTDEVRLGYEKAALEQLDVWGPAAAARPDHR
jgi:ketose-bisphosphate aldolase